MTIARALGLAGGTGGVDHIRQVFRVDVDARIGIATGLRPVLGLIQQQAANGLRDRQRVQQMALGQQQTDAAVVEHIGQAIPWIFRVQRYVGTAGLENRQQPQDHFHGTLDGDTHQHIRTDP